MEFSSTVSPDHECIIYVTEPDFRFFDVFRKVSLLKCSIKMLAITREMGDPIAVLEVFIELVVVKKVDCC